MSDLKLCFMPQIFVWTGGSFTLLQTLDFERDILSVAPFSREAVPYLLVCIDRQTVSCLLLEWASGRFQNPQPLQLSGRVVQVETINTRTEDTLLLVVTEGDLSLNGYCYVYLAHLNHYCTVNLFVFEPK